MARAGRRIRGRSGFGAAEAGTAAIEFAILVPVFLLFICGILAYGIYFGASHSIQQIAADAARTSIAGLSRAERDQLVADFISSNAGAYVLISPAALSYEIGDKPDDPSQYLVTIRYDASRLPIWNLYLPLPLPDRMISYSSTIRRGGL
ncbi:pilus assembly protein [Arsenicitalea aurantiaca]|uniref:Pilus assembly protein n=1 Tax=Arsenicitalea aurantiaca TaxID=1783274 RepID=A0A433X8D8_9HYPH|nr:TadE/TadG family type IV pilus assembly protein [Arsenicitalea aurantiaca]RUT30335.1 pilus assembly protein [Arsenicitalea aurantiaca]